MTQEPQREHEKSKQEKNNVTSFYEMLDSLLTQKNELLRSVFERKKKELQEFLTKHEDERDYSLELEIEKNKFLKELLTIVYEQYQRVSADYVNYQKRSAKQISESVDYEKEKMIKSLLPVLDNFEHTLTAAENSEDIESLRKGVKIIYEQMLSILKSYGVEQVSSEGKPFDPASHQALAQETAADKEDGIILKELMKCYRLGEKILRPGRAIVNKKAVEQDDNGSDEDRE